MTTTILRIPPSFLSGATRSDAELFESAQRNRFLSGCRDDTLRELLTNASLVRLESKTLLFEVGTPMSHGIFPLSGLIVGLHHSKNGASVVGGLWGRRACWAASPRSKTNRAGSGPKSACC